MTSIPPLYYCPTREPLTFVTPEENFVAAQDLDPLSGSQNPYPVQAAHYYRLAADEQHPQALYSLGLYHWNGLGNCNGGTTEAGSYFLQAGELGLAAGFAMLGLLLLVHGTTSIDEQSAIDYLRKALRMDHGLPNIITLLGDAYNKMGLFDDARLCYIAGAINGEAPAQYGLACHYLEELPRDPLRNRVQSDEKASFWFLHALRNQDTSFQDAAATQMAYMILSEKVTRQNLPDLSCLLQESADKLNPAATAVLVHAYSQGKFGLERSTDRVSLLLRNFREKTWHPGLESRVDAFNAILEKIAESQRDSFLLISIAISYELNPGPANWNKAHVYYKKAIDVGSDEAKQLLSTALLKKGLPLYKSQSPAEISTGWKYVKEAAALGNEEAKVYLDKMATENFL